MCSSKLELWNSKYYRIGSFYKKVNGSHIKQWCKHSIFSRFICVSHLWSLNSDSISWSDLTITVVEMQVSGFKIGSRFKEVLNVQVVCVDIMLLEVGTWNTVWHKRKPGIVLQSPVMQVNVTCSQFLIQRCVYYRRKKRFGY